MSAEDASVYRYGHFPELFSDLDPDVEVARDDPLIISRVVLPDHIRKFWVLMLQKLGQLYPHLLDPEHDRISQGGP